MEMGKGYCDRSKLRTVGIDCDVDGLIVGDSDQLLALGVLCHDQNILPVLPLDGPIANVIGAVHHVANYGARAFQNRLFLLDESQAHFARRPNFSERVAPIFPAPHAHAVSTQQLSRSPDVRELIVSILPPNARVFLIIWSHFYSVLLSRVAREVSFDCHRITFHTILVIPRFYTHCVVRAPLSGYASARLSPPDRGASRLVDSTAMADSCVAVAKTEGGRGDVRKTGLGA